MRGSTASMAMLILNKCNHHDVSTIIVSDRLQSYRLYSATSQCCQAQLFIAGPWLMTPPVYSNANLLCFMDVQIQLNILTVQDVPFMRRDAVCANAIRTVYSFLCHMAPSTACRSWRRSVGPPEGRPCCHGRQIAWQRPGPLSPWSGGLCCCDAQMPDTSAQHQNLSSIERIAGWNAGMQACTCRYEK